MRLEYTNILDEMVKNDKVINQYIDGRNLLSYLLVRDVITVQESVKFHELGPTVCTEHLIKVALKSRKDEDMIHFLNSLQRAKYDDAFCWLKEKLENMSFINEQQYVQIFDEKRNAHQCIWFEVKDPTANFIGREVQLKELHDKMLQSGKKVGTDAKKTVITGLSGIGKTQLALMYVKLYIHQYDNNIVWINAESNATLRNSFINLAEKLNINIKITNGVEKETTKIFEEVYTHLSMVKCLFVFDNADEQLKDDFYPSSQFEIFILITSRYQKWGQINVLHLDNFSPEEAKDFIRITLKITTNTGEDQVANLAKTLFFFPLALKQATAYINETSERKKSNGAAYSINDYIKEYNGSKKNLLSYKFDSDYGNGHFQITYTTWKKTMSKLEDYNQMLHHSEEKTLSRGKNIGKVAINILEYISYVAHEQIDMQIFFPIENKEEIGLAIQLLKEFSMVKEENGLITVHPLIQEMTRLYIKQKRIEREIVTTICELVETYFKKLRQSQDYLKLKIILPYSEKLLQEMKNWLIKNNSQQKHIEQERIKNLLIQMSKAYFKVGQQWQFKSTIEQLLYIKIEQYGPDHYEVARTLVCLSRAYGELGHPEKQKNVVEKALKIKEKCYGADHYHVVQILVNLGNAYNALGHPEKQKTLLEKALMIEKKVYGLDYYKLAITLINLNNTYGTLGHLIKQKTLLEKALVIVESHYSLYHHKIALTLINLGSAYGALRQPENQKILLEKALVIVENYFEQDHSADHCNRSSMRQIIALTLINLSHAYAALGQPENQKTLLETALVMQEKHYGPEHYEVILTLINLSNAYRALEQPEKQKNLLKKALVIQEKHYGKYHNEAHCNKSSMNQIIALTLVNLSNAYGALGQPNKQKDLMEKALIMQEKHYGPDHYEVAQTLISLGNAYGGLKGPEKQKTLLEKALMIKEKCYRPDHYHVVQILIDLGNAYNALGHPEKRKTLLEKASTIEKKEYGLDYYDLVITLVNLTNTYRALGHSINKKTLLEKAPVIEESHYSLYHHKIALTLINLGNVYGNLGQPVKQKTLLEKALVIVESYFEQDHSEGHCNRSSMHQIKALTLINLSNAYGALEQPEKQKTLLEKALIMQEKHYGPDHYEVALTLINLSNVYGALEQPVKQKNLLEKSLAIQEKHYGKYCNEGHCNRSSMNQIIALTLINLSNAYGDLGQPDKQKDLLEKALIAQENHYGPDHYEVATTLVNLGIAYGGLGQPEKQNTFLEKALMIKKNVMGNVMKL